MATIPSTERRTKPKPTQTTAMLNLTTSRGDLQIPPTVFTLAGFREWAKADDFPEKVKVAFIDGEVYVEMSNEEIQTHVAVKDAILVGLTNFNRAARLGKIYGDGVLVTNEAANVSNNPEAFFVTWETLESGRVELIPRKTGQGQFIEVQGSLDWVLEVLSDSSVRKDTVQLRAAYHRANVREYWLVDARGEEIDLAVLIYRKNGYARAAQKDGWSRSVVFGRSIRLTREEDRLGLWEYTLHIRED